MLLAAAAVISKLLGSVYTILLQNIIGDHGMGLFQMAYPIYATLLAVATAGFPVAISKLVSERIALGDEEGVKRTFRVAVVVLGAASVATFGILYFWADQWAVAAGDKDAAWAIRAIAPALLIVPLMSAIRGYFQGYQWMEPTAASQVLEQFVRVVTIVGLAVWLTKTGYGKPAAAAGAAFGAVTGAGAGMLLLLYYWLARHPQANVRAGAPGASARTLAKRLLYYAFPISLGALVVPLMNNVDVVTVTNLLKAAGESQQAATTDFGLLSGRAFKLMMLPTTLAAGIGIAVMPAVSEAYALGFRRLASERIDTAVRLTVLIALPASVGLALLATPVDIALFKDDAGARVIQVMACAIVFASVQSTVAAALQGAGWMYLPVVNLLIASGIKLLGNLLLVPQYGIVGASASTVASYAAATALNVYAMWSRIGERIRWRDWVFRPAVATFIMAGIVYAMESQWELWGGLDWARTWTLLFSGMIVVVAALIYAAALVLAGALTARELASVPKIGPTLAALCQRLGLVRT
jgi:O-antigen/teichoic acid export membrane protein